MGNIFSTSELKTETSLLGVSEQGGYVTEWKVKNRQGELVDVLYVGSELKRTGIPILFPYYGPSDSGMGQHGFGRNCTWKVAKQTKSEITLELTNQDLTKETKILYPYQFQTQIVLKLRESALDYSLKVINLGVQPLPIAPGLHPYWAVDHDKKSKVTVEGYLMDPHLREGDNGSEVFDVSTVDWDHNPPDIEYDFKNPVTIGFPGKKIVIEDLSQKITKLVVWSQPKEAKDHDFICFEPVTLTRGSFDTKPITVHAGESWEMNVNFKVKS